jgi:hypothetical protein
MLWAIINAIGVFLSAFLGKLYNNSPSTLGYQLGTLLGVGGNHVFFGTRIVFDTENIGLTADLAVFHVALALALRMIDGGFVPFPAACALETCVHGDIVR